MAKADNRPQARPNEKTVRHVFAEQLYTGVGDEVRGNQLLTLEEGRIASLEPMDVGTVPPDVIRTSIAAPGFIDVQINGAADVLFNNDPTVGVIEKIAWGARQGGTAYILPTFITDAGDRYRSARAAGEEGLAMGVPGLLGVHLEGPFLSLQRPGIHPVRFIRPLETDDVEHLRAAQCPILLTVAPERQDHALLRQLAEAGITIFAGHSNATHEELLSAVDAGLSGATHLFNAQSPIAARAPGTVGTVLMHAGLRAGIIADGYHVHPQLLAMASSLMGDRLFLVTDAMPTLAGEEPAVDLVGTRSTLEDGRLTGPDGTLAGAHLAMDEAVRNAVAMMGVSVAQALRMASGNAAQALGLQDELGKLLLGYRAGMTCLSADLHAERVIVDGLVDDR
ncbi:MAG: N-acetylglucosamine-6-phosphate deacetylase [Cohaesibacteraceae bacterium]